MRTGMSYVCPIMSASTEKPCVQEKCAWWQGGASGAGKSTYAGDCAVTKLHELTQPLRDIVSTIARKK